MTVQTALPALLAQLPHEPVRLQVQEHGDASLQGDVDLLSAALVARAHGGRLLLPAVAQGFAVELDLPLPPPQPALGAHDAA